MLPLEIRQCMFAFNVKCDLVQLRSATWVLHMCNSLVGYQYSTVQPLHLTTTLSSYSRFKRVEIQVLLIELEKYCSQSHSLCPIFKVLLKIML